MIKQVKNTEDISNLQIYKGSLKDITEKTFIVSIGGLKNLENEASNSGVKFKTEMLENTAAYLVTLE